MAVFTYTAKRRIVTLSPSWSKTGSDISAATTDDSFNSASTDLSGLSSGNYIKVSGFSNNANNGWHKVGANSTTNKITATENLVDEAAGAIVTIEGYEHGPGEQYSLEKPAGPLDPEDRIIASYQRTLSGRQETLLDRIESVWNLTTDWIRETEVVYWQEFLASVAAGETFSFDPYGSISSPDSPRNVIVENKSFRWSRVGSKKVYTISMTLLEV